MMYPWDDPTHDIMQDIRDARARHYKRGLWPGMNNITVEHILQSNLIEGVDDLDEVPKTKDAWNYLSAQPHLSVGVIQQTHRMILRGLMEPQDVGSWRKHNVTVGGRRCPDWQDVPSLMNDWINHLWEKGLGNTDPKTEHVTFEKIHPFADGNGRVGRMLMWYHEARNGQEPTLITYADRWDYYGWFPKAGPTWS